MIGKFLNRNIVASGKAVGTAIKERNATMLNLQDATNGGALWANQLDVLLLTRLHRLIHLTASPDAPFDEEKLIRKAIYSTFIDCRERGLERQATVILNEGQRVGV